MPQTADWPGLDAIQPLAPREFDQIRQLAYRTFGLDLNPGKEELVAARLRRLVRSGGFRSYREYYKNILSDNTGQSLLAMIDALATNHTSFLREARHFDYLKNSVVPMLTGRDPVEVWSAACSTGEEVWTLAMVLNEAFPSRRIRVTGSDVSGKALAFAERGEYPIARCQGVPPAWLSRYFVADGRPVKSYAVSKALRAQAGFRRINLVEPVSWHRQFPVIFCRNVMIYFDKPTQEHVVRQLSECLEPGGYLFVGHAESLTRVSHSLEYAGPAVYRKPGKREGRWI